MPETTTGRVLKLAAPPARTEPHPDVVAAFERWLARARAGEVRGVLVVADLGESVATGIEQGDGSRYHLVAGVDILKARLVDWINERGTNMPDPDPPEAPPAPDGEGG